MCASWSRSRTRRARWRSPPHVSKMASREGLCPYPNRCTRAAGKHGRHRFQHVRPCRPLWQNPRSAIMNARFSSSKHAIVYYLASLLSFFSALNARSCCRAEGAPSPHLTRAFFVALARKAALNHIHSTCRKTTRRAYGISCNPLPFAFVG